MTDVFVERRAPLPEGLHPLEQAGLAARHRDLGAVLDETRVTLALVAMVMCMEHPLDALDAELVEVIEDVSAARVDEDGGGPVTDDVDVADVPIPA